MPGTDPANPPATTSLVQQLTIAGWLLLGGEFGFILFQTERVRSVDGTRFATAWDQRIEVLSFVMLPPNMAALAPAAAVAVIATFLAKGTERGQWLDVLLRLVAGTAITMVFVGVAAIVEISTRVGTIDLDPIFLRLGGMSLAAGIAVLCRIADQA